MSSATKNTGMNVIPTHQRRKTHHGLKYEMEIYTSKDKEFLVCDVIQELKRKDCDPVTLVEVAGALMDRLYSIPNDTRWEVSSKVRNIIFEEWL